MSKWLLRFKKSFLNCCPWFNFNMVLPQKSSPFSKVAMQIVWTPVTLGSILLHTCHVLSTNAFSPGVYGWSRRCAWTHPTSAHSPPKSRLPFPHTLYPPAILQDRRINSAHSTSTISLHNAVFNTHHSDFLSAWHISVLEHLTNHGIFCSSKDVFRVFLLKHWDRKTKWSVYQLFPVNISASFAFHIKTHLKKLGLKNMRLYSSIYGLMVSLKWSIKQLGQMAWSRRLLLPCTRHTVTHAIIYAAVSHSRQVPGGNHSQPCRVVCCVHPRHPVELSRNNVSDNAPICHLVSLQPKSTANFLETISNLRHWAKL